MHKARSYQRWKLCTLHHLLISCLHFIPRTLSHESVNPSVGGGLVCLSSSKPVFAKSIALPFTGCSVNSAAFSNVHLYVYLIHFYGSVAYVLNKRPGCPMFPLTRFPFSLFLCCRFRPHCNLSTCHSFERSAGNSHFFSLLLPPFLRGQNRCNDGASATGAMTSFGSVSVHASIKRMHPQF